MVDLPTECPTCNEGYIRPRERAEGHTLCRECRVKKLNKERLQPQYDAINRGFRK